MIRPLMVLPVVAAVIAPLATSVVIPLRAPAVVTLSPDEARLNAPAAVPMLVAAMPLLLMFVVPVKVVVPVIEAPPASTVRPVPMLALPFATKLPLRSKLTTVAPPSTCRSRRSAVADGLAPPRITATAAEAAGAPSA